MKSTKVFMLSALVALFSLAAGSAFASPGDDGCVGNCGGGGLPSQMQGQAQLQSVAVSNRIDASSRSAAAAFAAGNLTTTDVRTGGQTTSVGGQSVSVTPGAVSLSVNTPAPPAVTRQEIQQNDYTIKNVPAFALGNVYPTAPCMGSSQVGGAGVGFSIGVGTSWTDEECSLRETSRSFSGLGLKEEALAILCTSKYAAAAPSCAKREEK